MRAIRRLAMVAALTVAVVAVVQGCALAVDSSLRVGVVRSATSASRRWVDSRGLVFHEDAANYGFRVDKTVELLRGAYPKTIEIGDSVLANPAALDAYDVVVTPRTLTLTATQRQVLRSYVARGGGLVSMFGTGRWDYVPARIPKYVPMLHVAQLYNQFDRASAWEWGEVSELFGVKFINDPAVPKGWGVSSLRPGSGVASNHAIVKASSAATIAFKVPFFLGDNEYARLMPNNHNVVPMLWFTNAGAYSGTLAAWSNQYYRGRVVAFPFQMYDAFSTNSDNIWTSAIGKSALRNMAINAVDWAAAAHEPVDPFKRVIISGKAWFTRGSVWVNQTVYNCGSTTLSGAYRMELYNPAGTRVWKGAYKSGGPVALPAGEGWTLGSFVAPVGAKPCVGIWRARLIYCYWDQLAGGWKEAYRDLRLKSSGASVTQLVFDRQVNPSLSWSNVPAR